MYHYHFMPTCIGDATLGMTAKACAQDNTCKNDLKTFGLNAYSTKKTLTPVALAKDGHIIYGPYNSDGTAWGYCDVDVCNGRMVDGYYSYVTTTFHPYFIGCWGPGNYPSLA